MTAGLRRTLFHRGHAFPAMTEGAPPDETDVEAADDGSAGHQPDARRPRTAGPTTARNGKLSASSTDGG